LLHHLFRERDPTVDRVVAKRLLDRLPSAARDAIADTRSWKAGRLEIEQAPAELERGDG